MDNLCGVARFPVRHDIWTTALVLMALGQVRARLGGGREIRTASLPASATTWTAVNTLDPALAGFALNTAVSSNGFAAPVTVDSAATAIRSATGAWTIQAVPGSVAIDGAGDLLSVTQQTSPSGVTSVYTGLPGGKVRRRAPYLGRGAGGAAAATEEGAGSARRLGWGGAGTCAAAGWDGGVWVPVVAAAA